MGSRPRHTVPFVRRLLSAFCLTLLAVAAGCTYSHDEPGLFGRDQPTPTAPATDPVTDPAPDAPQRTGAVASNLPVLGTAEWWTGDGLDIPVRIAVHAVRRIAGATVLDWSVTPLAGPGQQVGERLPQNLNLGLNRFGEGYTNVFLIDQDQHRVYRPLTARARADLQRCLCAPIWFVQRELRVGVTTLVQLTYPALPADVRMVSVDVATLPLFVGVPVTPRGLAPIAGRRVDLGRPAQPPGPVAETKPFAVGRPNGQRMRIGITRVQAGPDSTSIEWTLTTLTDGAGLDDLFGPPLTAEDSDAYGYAGSYASGPAVVAAGGSRVRLTALSMSAKLSGTRQRECLCTDTRQWASGLRQHGNRISLITNLPALPRNSSTVTIAFPGLPALHDVPVEQAPDAAFVSPGVEVTSPKTWTYRVSSPPPGWSVADWPTPLPNPRQLAGYRATVDDLR